ncbi:mushroom body large-type Kenyon cell-specific protein 1 isoform X2 [Chelonus insularis]|uniref:mushroom body large-type Kenyon cell-specific protein 1 isoform X2 n=1 Tax=Chelonus insularis TaxID=460826 RepID=UPI00158E7086|nr:mushroom body large-type Kenyon cell-specific protein 1 isoform X2 [Chelonus insularis]
MIIMVIVSTFHMTHAIGLEVCTLHVKFCLERVAEELMGRRRWKQYQDTLYSSTRSESATQPHHRLYPTLSTTCNLAAGSLSQVGHHQASSGPSPTATTTPESIVAKQQLTNHKNDELRLKPGDIKTEVEAATEENGTRLESLQHGQVLANLKQHQRQRKEDEDEGKNENGENDQEGGEKRLKLDENSVRTTISPLRENDTCRKNESTDTEDIKEKPTEAGLERVQVTPGLLRVKKEEELQELPQQVNCGGETTRSVVDTGTNRLAISVKEQPTDCPTLHFHRRASPPPEDWKPLDKCYLCLDGKLPHDDQPPLSPQSESSSSSRSAESPMSVQVDPMAASVVAAALSGTYPTLLPQWCLPPRETPLVGVQIHQETGQIADQPLDLSAKPKNSQDNNISMLEQQKIPLRMPTGLDPKSIFASSYRAKPRLTGPIGAGGVPVVGSGRRTYTEEELQAALRDIQSGKLGTRRAAVIYGIPRSTLRNKVYKLAMERERDASLTSTHSHPHESGAPASATTTITTTTTTTTTPTTPNTTQNASATTPPAQVDEAEDKELSGAEEEKEVEKALLKPLLSIEDLVRFSALEASSGESLRTLLQRGQDTGTEWPGFEHANIGPYIQKMLAAAAPFKGLETQDYRIPEVMKRLMSEDKRLNKDVNGDQALPHQLPHSHLLQSSQTQQSQSQQQRLPMTNDDFNPSLEDEASDSAQGRAILKIPSYKPASTPGSSKNGEPTSAAFAQSFAAASSAAASPGLLERASPAFSGTSSPTNSLVGKAVNFRDVIAKSISSKFQEGQSNLPGQTSVPGQTSASMLSETNPFKRGRYTPPQPQSQQQQQPKPQSQENKSKPVSGGKGTRPKRGKYRNYDRDSLVEAVRAVQRGEMSVHRAGSYYGVPHSTLEYKVKERHLMRPRKRDQKPPDDKAKEPAAAPAALRPGIQDKKPPLKTQKPFTPGPGSIPSPNGLKISPFLEGMPHLPFPHPFNFWGPTPFMPSPFIPGASNVPTMLPEQYFAPQRMRGLQEQQRSAIVQQQQQHQSQREREGSASEPGTSTPRGSSIVKTTREFAESLYDGSGANGSFLDNLIRSSLETGIPRDQRSSADGNQATTTPGQHHSEGGKALIDQLCRNSRRTPLPRTTQDSSEDESYRGASTRSLPERPERVPTVDLSPSPTDRARTDDQSSDRLTSPPTPMSVSRTGSRDEDTRDSRVDRGSREREVHNGNQEDREPRKTLSLQQQLNHYSDIHNLYSVSTDKKSACDSKLIVDQKTQQHSQQLVVQLQRSYNASGVNNRSTEVNQQNNSQSSTQPVQEPRGAVLSMEDSVEQ